MYTVKVCEHRRIFQGKQTFRLTLGGCGWYIILPLMHILRGVVMNGPFL
jgi:hypothetical protein